MAKQSKRWTESFLETLKLEGVKLRDIVIKKNRKNAQTRKFQTSVLSTTEQRNRQIFDHNPDEFDTVADLNRVIVYLGHALAWEIYMRDCDEDEDYKEMREVENQIARMAQKIDEAVGVFSHLQDQYIYNVITRDERDAMIERRLAWLGKYNLRELGEDKLRRLRAGDALSNIRECAYRGGDQKSGS